MRSPGGSVAARQGRSLRTAPSAITPPAGLTDAEVAERRSRGLGNTDREPVSRPVAEILRANVLTVLIAALGAASIVAFWAILQRRNRTHPNAAGEGGPGTPAATDEPPGDHASAAVIRSSSPARRVR